jgi:uncharacterized phage-associated protein
MVTVFDLADYILDKCIKKENIAITTWKLQKLVYYCQAWSLVWDEEPLFDQRIEAWANGPVCPTLYEVHRGEYAISRIPNERGSWTKLNQSQIKTVDAVLDFYGSKPAQYLRDLTHMERPWLEAREGLQDGVPSSNVIKLSTMKKYYADLYRKNKAK